MTLRDFEQMPPADQAYCIWQQGVFLLVRKQEDCRIFLYDMGIFFAEVSYHLETNRMGTIRSFKSVASLLPYLDLIDCSDLLL